MNPGDLVEVRILGFPIALWERASAHQEDVKREFEIVRTGEPEDSVLNRLDFLLEELGSHYESASAATWEEIRQRAAMGEEVVDVVFKVPVDAAAAARRLATMLNEVDEYCRSGEDMLSLASPPDVVAFREWFLGEFTRQISDGREPQPWPGHRAVAEETGSRTSNGASPARSSVITFAGDLDLATANQLRDLIQEHRNAGTHHLTVDLTDVKFMDSVGIGLLVTTHVRMTEEGFDLALIVPPRLHALLELSGLSDVLNIAVADGSA